MIEALIQSNRRLRIEYKSILNIADAEGLAMLKIIENYLSDYSKHINLSATEIEKTYIQFVEKYVADFKTFKETEKYPFELGKNETLNRTQYDIALMLSVFFIPVRYQIFRETIRTLQSTSGNILIIGVGAAIELELITKLFPKRELIAYDITIGDFVKQRYASSMLHEMEFVFDSANQYETILAIELLEHLSMPYQFIEKSAGCIKTGGSLICTTASNMPQFDHLYNFAGDNFDANIKSFHMKIEKEIELKHALINPDINSFNTFYHLVKV